LILLKRVLGDTFCDCQKPILLLKTAYGGRDLAIDFRPPSSGVGNYSGVKPMHFGWQYRDMIATILDGLAHISTLIPQYDEEAGYELAGFVWFQGWNDMISWPKVAEYQFNLANLIRDVRADLDVPNMPFVIGELGMKGLHPTGQGADRYMAMQQAEQAVAMMEEFRNSTMYVPTAKYVIANGSSYSGGEYHYFGRADTYCHIGRAFGEAMLSLMNRTVRLRTTCDAKCQMGPGWPEEGQARLRSTWSHGIVVLE
jgi:hypothetical protein